MVMRSKINTLVKQKKGHKKWVLVALLVLAVIVGGVAIIRHQSTHKKQVATHIPSKGPSKTENSSKKSAKTTTNNGNKASVSDKSTASSGSLIAPFGTFVSNHRPSLSGSPLLKQEKSVCNTTPGASCYILFMKDGIAKQLDPQTVDSTGSTYWIWDIGQAGLTQGTWKVTAVATLNGQTLSTDDGIPFEVQP
jgi:hypothetical protein